MDITQEINDLINRGLDRHLRLAVTGLSRAGKTAFITSLVNQLLHSATHGHHSGLDNLPLFKASRDKKLLGAKRIPQTNLMVPRFDYDLAIEQLNSTPPQWPSPTRDVAEIRLAIRFKPKKGARTLIKKTATLYLDIVDYPGEWLLDLPLLDMSFEQWSQTQFESINKQSMRNELAQTWLQDLEQFDLNSTANENDLAQLAESYTQYLHACKESGLHWVQPGRFVLPGELKGAPVLQFFPALINDTNSLIRGSAYEMLKSRFEEYKRKIVKGFYRQHFSTFDRQIILVDCLQPLNKGHDAFYDMSNAITQLMQSFKYGRNSLLKRLFSAKIDKVLFAATKADHVTPDQHGNLVSLLQQLVHQAWQHASYEGIEIDCLSLASIQATKAGMVSSNNKSFQAIQGITLTGDNVTLFPGEVPAKLPAASYWQKQINSEHQGGFDFIQFQPNKTPIDEPLPHIRMDKVLQFLLGDKLR